MNVNTEFMAREHHKAVAEIDREMRMLQMERDCGSISHAQAKRVFAELERRKLALNLEMAITTKERLIEEASRLNGKPLPLSVNAATAHTMLRIRRIEIRKWQQEIMAHRARIMQINLSRTA